MHLLQQPRSILPRPQRERVHIQSMQVQLWSSTAPLLPARPFILGRRSARSCSSNRSSFNGAISASSGSLASGDVIYLKGFNATYTTATPTFNASSDTTSLLVTDPHDSLSVSLTLDGNYSADTFIPSSASGGADIADPPPAPTIVNGGSLDISASSDDTVTFTGATGSRTRSQPESFTGQDCRIYRYRT